MAADSVSVVEAEFIVSAPDPEICPDRVWFVDDVYDSVVPEPRETVFEYVPLPSDPVPDTVIPPPDALSVVAPE